MSRQYKPRNVQHVPIQEVPGSIISRPKPQRINVSDLPVGFYLFGNKGTVWADAAHVALSGDGTHRTLCGTPMLSTNWARIQKVPTVGCNECLAVFHNLKWDVLSPDGFSIHFEDEYATYEEAVEKLNAWASNFEAQGYYSSPKYGRIPVTDIAVYCRVIPVRQPIDEDDAEE